MDTSKLIPEAITLAIYDRDTNTYGVTWQTLEEGTPILEYTTEDDTDFAHSVKVRATTDTSTETFSNKAEIKGFARGEKVRYRVGDECGVFSDARVFRTLTQNSDKVDFLLVTDTQDQDNAGAWFPNAWRDAVSRYPDAEFCINAGDIVQLGGSGYYWKMMMEYNSDFFAQMPHLPTAGNHDYWYCYLSGFDSVTYRHFNIDIPEQDKRHGIYYSVDVGPCHFTVLSSGDCMETNNQGILDGQLQWAKNDIASSDKKWKIVTIHNPLYSPGKYGSTDPIYGVAMSLREQFNRFFAENHVDMVFCGHDHVYSRTYPIRADGYPDIYAEYEETKIEGIDARIAVNPVGPIHFESGCGGNQDRKIVYLTPYYRKDFEKMEDMIYGKVAYSRILIEGDLLTVVTRLNDVNDGKTVKEYAFGIRKTK